MSERKRFLNDLRVVDLRAELERRNLDKSGVRGVLLQRLSKYIEDEGHDPATYMFDISDAEVKSTPTKRILSSESTAENMIVQGDVGDAAEPAPVDVKMDVDDAKPCLDNNLHDIKDGTEATQPIKPCLDNDSKEDNHKGDNHMDTEDSINLHLCEDELLNEETEITMKPKSDDGVGEDIAESTGNETAVNDAEANDALAQDAAGATDSTTSNDQQVIAEARATSNDGGEDNKDDNKDGEKRTDDTKEGGARNLWVSGLSGATRAKDLKQLCSKYGKVIGAKVVTNARTPGSRCYGYVTLASTQDAENCIKNLHKTKLHGRMMFFEKARSESESASRRQTSHPSRPERPERPERRASKDGSKENEDGEDGDKKDSKPKTGGEVSTHRSASHSRGKSHRSDKSKGEGSTRSRERRNWKEQNLERARELKRARDQLRMRRDLERERRERRIAADMEMHERARRQREEKHRLALELEQLRAERIKIEREKTELLRLERERHRLERERLELERLELKRAQLRLEVERRGRGYESSAPAAPPYRKLGARSPPAPAYERDRHKRPAAPPMSSSRAQLDAPPPPRFETGAYDRGAGKRDRDHQYNRDYPRHVSSGNMKYLTNGSTNDDSRQALPPGSRPKEPSRSYESRDSRAYRQVPAPPAQPEPRGWGASSRYTATTAAAAAAAPAKGSGNEAWAGAAPRYAAGYETRYPPTPAYQPPPPGAGAAYPDRYYRKY